ncbi:hypothetical protein CRYUN_Cryun16bG0004400 [Craigia yunnanensis]
MKTDKTEKTDNQVASDAKPDDEPGKSGTDENPVTASRPTFDAKSDSKASSNEEEKNNIYGTYGNPSGSSIESHHYYISDRPPTKSRH